MFEFKIKRFTFFISYEFFIHIHVQFTSQNIALVYIHKTHTVRILESTRLSLVNFQNDFIMTLTSSEIGCGKRVPHSKYGSEKSYLGICNAIFKASTTAFIRMAENSFLILPFLSTWQET